MRKSIYGIIMVFTSLLGAQVGIGTTGVDESAILEIESNGNKGLLVPTVSNLNSFSPASTASSLLVYNPTTGFNYWTGSAWREFNYIIDPTTPWYNVSTNNKAIDIEEDIYLNARMDILTRSSLQPRSSNSSDELFFASYQGDNGNINLGHFDTNNEAFSLDIATIYGTNSSNAQVIPNNIAAFDLGSIRFYSAANVTFFGNIYNSWAELKTRIKSNTTVTPTFMPSELVFEVNEAGDDNPDKIFSLQWDSRVSFSASESFLNWDTIDISNGGTIIGDLVVNPPAFNNHYIVGIVTGTGELIKVPRSMYTNNGHRIAANANAVYKDQSIKIEDSSFRDVAFQINNKSSVKNMTSLKLIGTPTFADDIKAKEAGLTKGMVYKTKEGQLKILN